MSKWYEVTMTIRKVFAVEMEDDATEDEVLNTVIEEELPDGVFDVVISSQPTTEFDIDSVIRHADERMPLDSGNFPYELEKWMEDE